MTKKFLYLFAYLFLTLPLTCCLYNTEEENLESLFNKSNEVPIDSVIDEIYGPLAQYDITQKKTGEYVHYELNQRIFTGPINKSHDLIATLDCRFDPDSPILNPPSKCKPSSDELSQYIVYQVNNYVQASWENQGLLTPYNFYVQKLQQSNLKALTSKSVNQLKSFATEYTYHNLRVLNLQEAPPKLVQDAPNCASIPSCQMDVKQISYDRYHRETDIATHHVVRISPQVPFLTLNAPLDGEGNPALFFYDGILSECIQFWTEIKDHDGKVYVSNCRVLKDFRYE